jgi:S1-C subfamily serine protease
MRWLPIVCVACTLSGPVSEAKPTRPQTAPAEVAAPVEAPVPALASDPVVVLTPAVPPPSDAALLEDEQNSVQVFRAAAPAAVFVTQTQIVVDHWRRRALEVPSGTGTGFIWDADGHVVTNFHVVANARGLTVTLQDQSTWPATLVGGDPRKDVAVLKIEAPKDKLTAVRRPAPGYVPEVGQKVLAIGNPFGLDHTLTTGVISAMGREVKGYGEVTIRGVIQTDASINPGNSGGPLLDSRGQLIGMNTMIYSPSGSSAGIGFAIPVATVERVVGEVITTGKVEVVGLGVALLDDRYAQQIGVRGVIIQEVLRGSPAEAAGLMGLRTSVRGVSVGDVIVSIDDKPIASYDDYYTALDTRRAGEKVRVGLLRGGTKQQTVEVPLVIVNDTE